MNILNKFKNNSGQVMVEALVALSVIVVGLLGVFTLTSTSIGINRVDADRYVAINLAKEGIELVKNLLDRNIIDDSPWNTLPGFGLDGSYEIDYDDPSLTIFDNGGRPFYFGKAGGGYKYQEEVGDVKTNFKREIKITNVDASHIKVISTVYWQSKGGSYDFSVEDHFYDLKEFKWNLNH